MQKKKSIARAEAVIVLCLILAILLPQLIGTTSVSSTAEGTGTISSVEDFDGLTFASIAGSLYEGYIREYFPSSECVYVSDWSQTVLSVVQNKADAFLIGMSSIPDVLDTYEGLAVFPVSLCRMEECFGASRTEKGEEVIALFNEYLAEISLDGTIDAILAKWANSETAPDHIDIPELTGERGTITIGTALDWSPYSYATGESPCGSFIDLTYRFCAWAGYIPKFEYTDFSSALAGISTGIFDFLAYGVTPTEERSEQMLFTDPLFGDDVYIVAGEDAFSFEVTNATLADYADRGVTVALMTGTDTEEATLELYPDAEILYFDTLSEVYTAVSTGKAELGMTYDDSLESVMESFDNVAMLYEPLTVFDYAFSMQKTEEGAVLRDEYNAFIRDIRADGTYDDIISRWASGDESVMKMKEYSYTGEKGILRIGTGGTWYPKTYYEGDELTGELIELTCAFCAACGYTPEFQVTPFTSELTGILSGNLDMLADAVQITPERLEQLYFSDAFLTSEIMLITRTESTGTEQVSKFSAFIESMKSSFEKNFIREGRWRMLLSGLGTTVALSVLAAIGGTLLGCGICALRMSKNSYLIGFARIFIKILQGTPIVVLLLVLYYVIFGKAELSAFWVCVCGFSLDFAAYSSEIFRTGIEGVPEGQRLAARALGFGRSKTFIKVILPQALVRIVPVFSGQFISMVKMTSVAGYIAVQDLTKASDIIRSRTYESFFPLISTAVIYFLIASLLVSVLRMLERRLDPARRPKKLKGVKIHAD